MGDTAAAQAQTPDPAAPAPPIARPQGATRAERRAGAIARLQSDATVADTKPAPQPASVVVPKPAAVVVPKPAAEAKPDAPAAKPVEVAPEKPDPAADRGLRAIEQAKKKWLDEQSAAKAELEVQRAEVARLRKEAEGKVGSIDELRKLKPTDLLARLDHLTDDDFDILSRAAYARTRAGKVDPRAQAAAQEAERAQGGRAAAAELAEMREHVAKLEAELRGEFTRRDQASFAERWVADAVKAIPADQPTLLSKLHANEPDTAKRTLHAIGGEIEKETGETPTHAEVIAEFEKRARAQLKALGFDADALLAPPPAAAPKAPAPTAARTLDVGAANVTRPANAPKTRDEKRAHALANLRDRQRATADQT